MPRIDARRRLVRTLAVLLAVGLGAAGVSATASAGTAPVTTAPALYVGTAGVTGPFLVGFGTGATGDVAPLTAVGGSLRRASGLARDAAGTIWVADSSANTVSGFAVGSGGVPRLITTLAGPHTQLAAPTGLAFDASGDLWVANADRSTITEYAPGANRDAAPISTLGGLATQIYRPQGIAFDAAGNLLVAGASRGAGASAFELFGPDASGNTPPLIAMSRLAGPLGGVAVDGAGQIDVTDSGANAVRILNPVLDGTGKTLTGPATGLASPAGVALDSAGHLWVANAGTASVTEYAANASGNAAPIATIGGKATNIARPQALLVLSGPAATTSADRGVSQRSAGLVGTVLTGGEPTTYHFELGLTTAYGTTTAERSATGMLAPQLVRETVSLPAGVTEHYRLVAHSQRGTAFGADRVLTTVSVANGILPTVYVVNGTLDPNPPFFEQGSVTVYAPGSRGDMPPMRRIAGPDTQLTFPRGIAVDSAGDLFVATWTGVVEFAPGANGDARPIAVLTDAGGPLINNGSESSFLDPGGVAVDSAGHLLVSNVVAGTLLEYTRVNGAWAIASRMTGLGLPGAVAFGPQDQELGFDVQHSIALEYAPAASDNAAPIASMTFGAGFQGFEGIAADASGDVTVVDSVNGSLIRRVAGALSDGALATQLSVGFPVGLAIDASGRELVATDINEVRTFAAGAVENATPISILSGPGTGLGQPVGIAVSPPQLAITTGSLPDAAVGQAYGATLTAGGATPPYYWTAVGGLPPGLVLNPVSGQISGTPTRSGLFKITATATDASKPNPPSAIVTLMIRITPPIVESVDVTDGARGTLSAFPLDQTGSIAPLSSFGQANGLLAPSGVAVDASGRIYVANSQSNAITELASSAGAGATPDRTISGANTGLLGPDAIALGPDGKVYVSNAPSQAITVYTAGASGDATPVRTIAGADTGLDGPAGMTINAAGDLWVANQNGDTLTEYGPTADGDAAPIATLLAPAFLHGPTGVGQDAAGHLLVTNRYGAAVDRFAANATGVSVPLSIIQGPDTGLAFPHGIDIDDQGRIYVANENGPSITVYAENATDDAAPLATITGAATGLASPEGLAVVPPLSVRTRTLPTATVGRVYRATLRAALGTAPYAWRLTHGHFPAGLHLTRKGIITGVPRIREARRVRVRVGDSSRHRMIDTRRLTLRVACAPGRFGAHCTHGPPGTRRLDLRLTVGRCAAAQQCGTRLKVGELAVRTGPVNGVLLRGRATIARGRATVGKHGPARLVLHARRHPRPGLYHLHLRQRGHLILAYALLGASR